MRFRSGVYNHSITDLEDLKRKIALAWNELSPQLCKKQPKCLNKIVQNRGGATKFWIGQTCIEITILYYLRIPMCTLINPLCENIITYHSLWYKGCQKLHCSSVSKLLATTVYATMWDWKMSFSTRIYISRWGQFQNLKRLSAIYQNTKIAGCCRQYQGSFNEYCWIMSGSFQKRTKLS